MTFKLKVPNDLRHRSESVYPKNANLAESFTLKIYSSIIIMIYLVSSPVGSLCHTRGIVRRPSFVVRRPASVVCRLCPP